MSNIIPITNKFNIFNVLDQQLVNNIKLFCLNKNYLLFITLDNSLFQYIGLSVN